MKNKIIITIGIVCIIITGLLFGNQYLNSPEKKEVEEFIQSFSSDLKSQSVDSLLKIFQVKQNDKEISRVLNLLSGKTSSNGKSKPLFAIQIDADNAEINIINPTIISVKIPLYFSNQKLEVFNSF